MELGGGLTGLGRGGLGGLEARIPAMRVGRRKPIDDDDGLGVCFQSSVILFQKIWGGANGRWNEGTI